MVYVTNDTEFNESFAATVEAEGVQALDCASRQRDERATFERAQQRRARLAARLEYRERLAALYAQR